ncbi:MAG: LysM peptidoglycan-binding domain-containing protein [Anaerolineales bacterium]|nr:LysM peptidoglycan-binding domain-containing protein [Anaerolineales bacterium]
MNLVHGVDVSYWEPRIDWRVVRTQGFRFALIRATSGVGYVDPKFKPHWEGARTEGLLRGAYHYLIATQDAKQQADLFISTISADRGELPPIIDLEDKYNENASNSKIIDTCKAILDRVEKAFGVKPMIYSRTQYLNVHVSKSGKAPSWAKDYPLWVAQYPYVFSPDTMPNKNMPTQAAGWQDWMFWQYSETALVNGVTNENGSPTECDLNWFRGTEEELYAFANIKPKEPVTYTVKDGDTFKSIAEKYKITVEELLTANPELLQKGAKLAIPVPTISKPIASDTAVSNKANSSTKTYTVKQGDTVGSIAAKYGVTVDAIKAINPNLTNPNLIYVGQVIVIP